MIPPDELHPFDAALVAFGRALDRWIEPALLWVTLFLAVYMAAQLLRWAL